MNIPSCYVDGYEIARKLDAVLAKRYIRHTTAGDPVADAVVAELARTSSPAYVHRIIATTLDHHNDLPAGTPEALRNLIADAGVAPDWFDREMARDATRGFLRNSEMVLGALVGGAIIEGFSSEIPSFYYVSRIGNKSYRDRELPAVLEVCRIAYLN